MRPETLRMIYLSMIVLGSFPLWYFTYKFHDALSGYYSSDESPIKYALGIVFIYVLVYALFNTLSLLVYFVSQLNIDICPFGNIVDILFCAFCHLVILLPFGCCSPVNTSTGSYNEYKGLMRNARVALMQYWKKNEL